MAGSFGRRGAGVAVGLCALMFAGSAKANPAPYRYRRVEVPSNLVIGNQTFDASVDGLRLYLDSIRTTSPDLFAKLTPDVEELESRQTVARTALAAGLGVGVGLFVVGLVTRKDCTLPPVTDPNFAAGSAAWSACNNDNMQKIAMLSVAGLAAMVGGGIIAWTTNPGRDDVLNVVNKHNRLNPDPLRLQIGYDPSQRFARAGVALTF